MLTKDRLQEPFVYFLELNLFTAVQNQNYSTLLPSSEKNSAVLFAVPTPPSQEIMPYIHTWLLILQLSSSLQIFFPKPRSYFRCELSLSSYPSPSAIIFILDAIIKKKYNQSCSIASLLRKTVQNFACRQVLLNTFQNLCCVKPSLSENLCVTSNSTITCSRENSPWCSKESNC